MLIGWALLSRVQAGSLAAVALLSAAAPAAVGMPRAGGSRACAARRRCLCRAQVYADRLVPLRQGWSLAAGLSAGAAASWVGSVVDDAAGWHDALGPLPMTVLPVLVLGLAVGLPIPGSGPFRRAAFGVGAAASALVAGTPVVLLAGWLPIRSASALVIAADLGCRPWCY